MKETIGKCMRLLGSHRFFYGVIVFFVLESLWVAVSAVYPMAFDEDFHVGIIKIYSHQWLPFLSSQPNNAATFGALQSDPSYLYHYVMSFPYRLVALLTHNEAAQVIVLRCINIALAVTGVVLFQKVLRRAGTSPVLTNIVLALFVLIPITPLLAGQVNYDNLILPLIGYMCLLVFAIHTDLQKKRLNVRALGMVVIVCLLASLVKYAFLPLAAMAALFIGIRIATTFRGHFKQLPSLLVRAYQEVAPRVRLGLVVGIILASGLFVQRYGVNLVRYHTPVPECDVALSEEQCATYGPWIRNYELAAAKEQFNANPLQYTWHWVQALHYRLFFTVNGPADSYRNYPPLPLPSAAGVIIFITGTVALLLYGRPIFRGRPFLVFLFLLGVVYCGVLWVEDYSQYVETGEPVAINGRYLLPILLPLAAVYGRALSIALGRRQLIKAVLAGAVLLLFVQGGGTFSFIARSDEAWYWANTSIIHANNGARKVLAPLLIEGTKYY